MLERGWIKLHRKSLDHPVFQDAYLWKTFCYCLMQANHKGKRVLWNDKEMILQPGQFITGRASASGALQFKSKMWDRKCSALENLKILTRKTTNRWTLITIVNWDKYQLRDYEDDQADDQQMTSKGPANDHKQEGEEYHYVSKEKKSERNVVRKGPEHIKDILGSPQEISPTLSPPVSDNGRYPSAAQIYAALRLFFQEMERRTGIAARWPRDTTTKKHCLTMQQRGHTKAELEGAFRLLAKKYKDDGGLRLTNRRFSPAWELMDKLAFTRTRGG